MILQVLQIRILGPLLRLVRHMDQQIETIAIRIALRSSQELMFVKQYEFMNIGSKRFQETSTFLAVNKGFR